MFYAFEEHYLQPNITAKRSWTTLRMSGPLFVASYLPILFPEAAILLVGDRGPHCPFRLTKQRGLWERDWLFAGYLGASRPMKRKKIAPNDNK